MMGGSNELVIEKIKGMLEEVKVLINKEDYKTAQEVNEQIKRVVEEEFKDGVK